LATARGSQGGGTGLDRGVDRGLERCARRDRGLDRISLETGAANTRARGFYERQGYQDEEVRLTRVLAADLRV